MNKKTIGFGLATLSLGVVLIAPLSADAFWGEGQRKGMSQEKFTEMKQSILSCDSVEEFREAMKSKRDERKAAR